MRSLPVGKFTNCVLVIVVVALMIYTLPVMYVTLHGYVGKTIVDNRWAPILGRDAATRANFSLQTESTLGSTSTPLTSSSESVSLSSDLRYHGHDLLEDVPFTFDKRFKNPCWFEGFKLKCLPYFFVIGVKKGGTTEVFSKIMKHPEVIPPGFKEAQFFARGRFHPGGDDINKYVGKFTSAAYQIQSESGKSVNTTNPFITGEGSPSNLHLNSHWMSLPRNEHLSEPRVVILDYIRHFLPKAKLIITFRDPIERLYSDYYHEYGTLKKFNHPNPQQFHQIVASAIDMYTECFDSRTVRSCVYDPDFYSKTKIQVQLGIYYIFWEELIRVFPRQQILVIQNKNISTIETYRRLYSFLNIAQLSDNEIDGFINSSRHGYVRKASYKKEGPMLNATFNMLYEFYKPFNEKMAALMGDSNFLYRHELV